MMKAAVDRNDSDLAIVVGALAAAALAGEHVPQIHGLFLRRLGNSEHLQLALGLFMAKPASVGCQLALICSVIHAEGTLDRNVVGLAGEILVELNAQARPDRMSQEMGQRIAEINALFTRFSADGTIGRLQAAAATSWAGDPFWSVAMMQFQANPMVYPELMQMQRLERPKPRDDDPPCIAPLQPFPTAARPVVYYRPRQPIDGFMYSGGIFTRLTGPPATLDVLTGPGIDAGTVLGSYTAADGDKEGLACSGAVYPTLTGPAVSSGIHFFAVNDFATCLGTNVSAGNVEDIFTSSGGVYTRLAGWTGGSEVQIIAIVGSETGLETNASIGNVAELYSYNGVVYSTLDAPGAGFRFGPPAIYASGTITGWYFDSGGGGCNWSPGGLTTEEAVVPGAIEPETSRQATSRTKDQAFMGRPKPAAKKSPPLPKSAPPQADLTRAGSPTDFKAEASPGPVVTTGVKSKNRAKHGQLGSLLWNPPTQMRVKRSERVEVRLGDATVAMALLNEGLSGEGAQQTDHLEIAPLMSVKMIADEHDFTILALSTQDQLIRQGSVARWDYDVTPLRAGHHSLRLLVSMRLKVEGNAEVVDLPSYDRPIVVSVAPLQTAAQFFTGNWQWIASTLAVPVLGWAVDKLGLVSAARAYIQHLVSR